MSQTYRIGCNIQLNDIYWVQLNEAVLQHAQQVGIALLPLDIDIWSMTYEAQIAAAEELLIQDLDALIGWNLPDALILHLLENDLPIVHIHARSLRHPRFVSANDLYDVGEQLARFLAQRIGGRGEILMVGGLVTPTENGMCRIAGFQDALAPFPHIHVTHVPSVWRSDEGFRSIHAALAGQRTPFDAIFGLSDSLALAGRAACLQHGLIDEHTPVVGINGDPHALAAITQGRMTATVDTSVTMYGQEIVDLAIRAARREALPAHFSAQPHRLVTMANVAEAAAQKLIGIAEIPNRLVGINVQQERQRLLQLETSLAINRQVGAILDRRTLSQTLAELMRTNYGYDHVRVLLWSEAEQALIDESADERAAISAHRPGLLADVLHTNELCFIPNTTRSQRFAPDPQWPRTRSRVVLPLRLGGAVTGLLDLHNERCIHHTQAELLGLQVLADQVAITLRNADLVGVAETSRAIAEKADRLKTQLLANVSHELRTPLNVIMGYSQAALSSPQAGYALAPGLRRDLQHIYNSGEHLMRLINDLLDLSRAEIDELDLFPEAIDTHSFLQEVFNSFVPCVAHHSVIAWRLELPGCLPIIHADSVRLRQVLLNLLSNAAKFTAQGEVVLGATVELPHVHLWVRDTGIGIDDELQARVFDPFVTNDLPDPRLRGVGLGLCIARRLVLLHHGMLTVESTAGGGSTFHIHLPLPALQGMPTAPQAAQPLLLIVGGGLLAPAIAELCQRQRLNTRHVHASSELDALLDHEQPAAIAWNITTAKASEWALVEALRTHPLYCQLPFLLFGSTAGGLTNILTKPTSSQTLVEAISALRPATTGAILVVDDDPQTCELYQRLIGATLPEYTVYSASNGRAALDLMAHLTPSMVILDLSMPELDGFGVLAHMRARRETCDTPVLVVSSRVLSLDDIQRLDHAHVTLQTKDMLMQPEAIATLQRALHGTGTLSQSTSMLVKRAVAYLQQHYDQPISRQELADTLGVSKNYLSEIFHQELGISPWDYLNRYRVQRAKDLLRTTGHSITSIAAQVGFDDSSYFGRIFHRHVGLSPSEYRN